MKTWRTKQKEHLNKLLYDTALLLFRTQGFENTTVQQITQQAGVAKGTFFNYFPSKEHVVTLWYQQNTLNVLSKLDKKTFSSSKEAIVTLISRLANWIRKESRLFEIKAGQVISCQILSEQERSLDLELIKYCQRHITNGVYTGEIDSNADIHFLSALIVTILTGTIHEWIVSSPRFALVDILVKRIEFVFQPVEISKQRNEGKSR